MDRTARYLFSNFLSTFASLFATLFLIMSIVFFIQIARITSYIEITFIELFKLYMFMLPRVLLFTVPIAFFASLALMFFRLSRENESIVLFTLGYSPVKIAKFFLIVSGAVSAFLIVTAIVLIPTAAELNSNFVSYKKTVAKLNLKTTEFGQKFSDWMVFIQNEKNDENGTIYEGVTLYSPKEGAHRFVLAKNARLTNNNAVLEVTLSEGKIYDMRDASWHKTDFGTMKISTAQEDSVAQTKSFVQYWQAMSEDKKRAKDFATYVLIALFPLATTLFALSLGIVTYRYEKGFVYFGIFGVLFGYFTLIMLFSSRVFIAIAAIFLLFFIASIFSFRAKILKRY